MLRVFKNVYVLLLGSHFVFAFDVWPLDTAETQIVKKVIVECLEKDTKSCFAEKLARAVDHAIDWDIPIIEGMTLRHNKYHKMAAESEARSLTGFDLLYDAISRFIDAHTLTLHFAEVNNLSTDLSEDGRASKDPKERYGGVGGVGGGGGGGVKRIGKKERRMVQYALMVLLGIFGLTAPLVLKILAIMAGKALISSKIALIMLGSIALKKIFQADSHSPVKVHTHTVPIHEDEHDRFDYTGYNYYSANKYNTKSPISLVSQNYNHNYNQNHIND